MPKINELDESPVTLEELLDDAATFLTQHGMKALGESVTTARRRLGWCIDTLREHEPDKQAARGEVITGRQIDERAEGSRAWWQLPQGLRETVIASLQLVQSSLGQPDPADHLAPEQPDAPNMEAFRAALELLTPDWRTSLLTQIATLRGSLDDEDADRALARAADALELRSDSIPPLAPPGPLHRPVFYADAVKGEAPPLGLQEDCGVCSTPPGTYCDPTKHPEVPGEG